MVDRQGDRVTLASLSTKLDDILGRLDAIENRFEKFERESAELKSRISQLEDRVDYLEGVHRHNNIVLSGNALASLSPPDDCSSVVIDLLKSALNYELARPKLLAAYRIGTKPLDQSPDNRKILVKLCNAEIKKDLIIAFRSSKPANLFGNDDLTPAKASLLYKIRQVKIKNPTKIAGCGSRDGEPYILLKPPASNERPQRIFLRNEQHLDEFCSKSLGSSLSELLDNAHRN